MGFEIKYQRVTFGDDVLGGRYNGFEIVLNELAIGMLTELEKLAGVEENPDDFAILVRALGVGDPTTDPPTPPGIRSWNLTEDGAPVPVSAASVGGLHFLALLHVINEWQGSVDVDPKSLPTSRGGGPLVVELPPTDVPYVSPETLQRLASTSG
jgi:hypothetical protein